MTSNTSHQVTVKNKLVPKAVSFSKVWLSMTANVNDIKSTDLQAWLEGKTISVTLKRSLDGTEDTGFAYTYEIDDGMGPFQPTDAGLSDEEKAKYQLTKTTDGNVTTFTTGAALDTIDIATGKTYTYYFTETGITDGTYTTTYGKDTEDGFQMTNGAQFAQDRGVIINQESAGYELPATGGPGTTLYNAIGAALLLLGTAWLLLRRRRQA